MECAQDDLVINHGCIVREAYEVRNGDGTNYDVLGWVGKAQIRRQKGGDLIAEFVVEIDEDESLIILEMDLEVSNAIPPGVYLWDLVISKVSGEPEQYIKGKITKELIVTEP